MANQSITCKWKISFAVSKKPFIQDLCGILDLNEEEENDEENDDKDVEEDDDEDIEENEE